MSCETVMSKEEIREYLKKYALMYVQLFDDDCDMSIQLNIDKGKKIVKINENRFNI